jgi:uncharacterized oligopeptide transporter (OPT) family protein
VKKVVSLPRLPFWEWVWPVVCGTSKSISCNCRSTNFVTNQVNKFWPSATINGEITPEYLGVGYIIGPKIGGVLVAGSVLAWWAMIPLIATLVAPDTIALQLVKLGYLTDINTEGGPGNWDPAAHTFGNYSSAIYRAYIRQIGAGAVAAGGFITLMKTIPTIISSFRESISSLKEKSEGGVFLVQKTTFLLRL